MPAVIFFGCLDFEKIVSLGQPPIDHTFKAVWREQIINLDAGKNKTLISQNVWIKFFGCTYSNDKRTGQKYYQSHPG